MAISNHKNSKSINNIYNAALSAMEGSTDELTVKSICDIAGITRPTFYRYFTDIDHLMTSLTEKVLDELKASVTIIKKTPLKEMTYNELPINMVKLFAHILDNKHFYEVFLLVRKNQYFTEQMLQILEEYIERGVEYGAATEDVLVPLPLLKNYSAGAYFHSILWWMKNGYPYTPEEMTATLLRLSVKGPFREGLASFIRE